MEQKNPESISWIAHESIVARMERHTKRLWVLCIIIFAALIATNIGWLVYESQFEDVVTVEQDVDSGEAPAYVNGTGEMTINGEDQTAYN